MVLRTCRAPARGTRRRSRAYARRPRRALCTVGSAPQDLGLDGRSYGHAVRGVANADLVSMALEGGDRGQDAWNEIVRRNKRAVWKVAWSFQTSAADRDDIFQCTWMRAIERLYQLRDPDRIHVWLMQIARHEALALLRRQGRLVPVGDPDDQVEHPIDAEVAEHHERLRMARAALAAAPEECRTIIRMLTIDNLTYHEIEEIMGWAPGGTSIRRARCMAKLQRSPEIAGYLRALERTGEGDG